MLLTEGAELLFKHVVMMLCLQSLPSFSFSQSVVKLMRSILLCLLRQADRVESFKKTLKTDSALHAKYSMSECFVMVMESGAQLVVLSCGGVP